MPPRETLCGILRHANSCPGFSAILKQRFSDFKVHEIDRQNVVARLTENVWKGAAQDKATADQLSEPTAAQLQVSPDPSSQLDGCPPTADVEPEQITDKAEPNGDAQGNQQVDPAATTHTAMEAQLQRFRALAGEENAEKLKAFFLKVKQHEDDPDGHSAPESIFLEAKSNKEHRRTVHNFFKQPLFANIETETLQRKDDSPQDSIRVSYISTKRRKKGMSNGRRNRDWPSHWPGGDQKFVQFLLYKENMDTQAALNLLGRLLRVPISSFGVAGTKDKRGATVQNVTAFKIHPGRLADLNPKLRLLQTGKYSFASQGLHLGGLNGNEFDIILRSVQGSPAEVATAADALRKSGFINYFGLQRFGNEGAATNEIGQLLIKGQWEAAVNLIMQPRSGEREPMLKARRLFLEKDLSASNKLMPPYASAEKAILQVLLHQGPSSYLPALLRIPRSLRTIYLHAVQSYLWNLAASHRAAEPGFEQVQVGDLVLPPEADSETEAVANEEAVDEPASLSRMQNVQTVTQADVDARKYTIEDVVLPLPGSKIIYPQNETGQVYQQEAEKLGLNLTSSSHKVKEFAITSLPGDYRKLVHKPKQLNWQLLAYSGVDQDLGYTDLDALQNKPRPPIDILDPGAVIPEGKHLGLRLSFQLPPSCYATMLIRELMKETTATAEHRERTLITQTQAATSHAEEKQDAGNTPLNISLD